MEDPPQKGFDAATTPQAPGPESHHRGNPATPESQRSSRQRSRSPLRPTGEARSTDTEQRWWPTTTAWQTSASRFGRRWRRRSSVGGHAQLKFANPDDVVDAQFPATPSLRVSVDRDRFGREKRLDFGSAADHAFQLQQLTETDRFSPNMNLTPHQPNRIDDRGLYRQGPPVRRGARRVRYQLRRPDRPRPPAAGRRHRGWRS
jgi:hypothetical protein